MDYLSALSCKVKRVLYQTRSYVYILFPCSSKACLVPNLHLDIAVYTWLL